jgi:21S rRNA (GM2251-2'-O)-methyltransferase
LLLAGRVLHTGNEGYGVRPLVKRLCTQLVQIEMATGGVVAADADAAADRRTRLQLVDSLNVSVATGILLHHMVAAAKQ